MPRRPIALFLSVLAVLLSRAPLAAECAPHAECAPAAAEDTAAGRTAAEHYSYARSLAAQGRRAEAETALQAGQRLAPNDPRFPTELAAIAFLDERYADAKKHLKRALQLAPNDPYLIDFLATVYLLEENLEAALLHWNRIGKPRVEQVRLPVSRGGDVVLLDRALAFAPASTLQLSELQQTRARLDHLDFYSQYRFDLLAREDQNYDLHFQSIDLAGWGASKPAAALSLLRGVPYQTVHADFYNVNGRGLNIESLARWDPRKRRVYVAGSHPIGRDPSRRYEFFADARDEDWRFDSAGPEALAAGLTMQKAEAGLTYSAIPNRRLRWHTGVTLAHRKFRHQALETVGASPGTAGRFREGPSLNSVFGLDMPLRLAERRLSLDAAADWRLGRFWGENGSLYSRWTQSLTLRWFPNATGNDYAVETRWRSGQTFGAAPFDELYALGMDRDTDLWLRGHRATANGYKGAALLGDRYLLWNSELDKIVYRHPLLKLTAGPFLDGGAMHDSRGWFGSPGWRWDSGVQCKAALAGRLTVAFSYGRNLQSGRDTFFWRIVRR